MTETLFQTTPAVRSDALISQCGRYRYWLTRTWDADKPPVCWVMLNPSTADASADDPTIRRCMAFARAWGAGGIVVVNLFALRATDPRELRAQPFNVIGPDNDWHILASTEGRRVIAAWGAHGGQSARDRRVMRLLEGRDVVCLGVTKDGFPRHPLYVRRDMKPVPFSLPK